MMRVTRAIVQFLILILLLGGLSGQSQAAQQRLPTLSHKFYPGPELVFVEFHNPSPTAVDTLIVNMRVRESEESSRVIAIGQARLPAKLVMRSGERASTRVPIIARSLRDIPVTAAFDFRITGKPVPEEEEPPELMVQDSSSGKTLEVYRDAKGVPTVLGFIELSPTITDEVKTLIQAAILTFYDEERNVVWSEFLPLYGKLANNESILLWGRYEQITDQLVPAIDAVEVIFTTDR